MANEPNYERYPMDLLLSNSFYRRQKLMYAYAMFVEDPDDVFALSGTEKNDETYEEFMTVLDRFWPENYKGITLFLPRQVVMDMSISNEGKLLYMLLSCKQRHFDSEDAAKMIGISPLEINTYFSELNKAGYLKEDLLVDKFHIYTAKTLDLEG